MGAVVNMLFVPTLDRTLLVASADQDFLVTVILVLRYLHLIHAQRITEVVMFMQNVSSTKMELLFANAGKVSLEMEYIVEEV